MRQTGEKTWNVRRTCVACPLSKATDRFTTAGGWGPILLPKGNLAHLTTGLVQELLSLMACEHRYNITCG